MTRVLQRNGPAERRERRNGRRIEKERSRKIKKEREKGETERKRDGFIIRNWLMRLWMLASQKVVGRPPTGNCQELMLVLRSLELESLL